MTSLQMKTFSRQIHGHSKIQAVVKPSKQKSPLKTK